MAGIAKTEVMECKKNPICILVLGMAGAGKTTFVNKLASHLQANKNKYAIINLDPAVQHLPYTPYIDIRATVSYSDVKKKYKLGPNGAIVTSLNLFSMKFNDIISLVEKREDQLEYLIFDTPGQMEVFNWSASGLIIAQSLASTYPTTLAYITDTPRSTSPQTFMSNMLYACALLYKYKLPLTIVLNKIDVISCDFAIQWMQDFQTFDEALSEQSSHVSNLTSSLCLGMEEFYSNIKVCGVSAVSGQGFDSFVDRLKACAIEFEEYREEFQKIKAESSKPKATETSESQELREVRQKIREEGDMFLELHAEEDDGECLDEEDTETKNEQASFQEFLKQKKDSHAVRKEAEIKQHSFS